MYRIYAVLSVLIFLIMISFACDKNDILTTRLIKSANYLSDDNNSIKVSLASEEIIFLNELLKHGIDEVKLKYSTVLLNTLEFKMDNNVSIIINFAVISDFDQFYLCNHTAGKWYKIDKNYNTTLKALLSKYTNIEKSSEL